MMESESIVNLTPFGVCYSKITPEQVKDYKLVIIEPDFYSKSEVVALKKTGTKIIAYMSLGEVNKNRWYYPNLEARGFKGTNENWGSSFLDLNDKETQSILLDRVLPEVISKGVDGVFLDTIDAVAPYTERSDMQNSMSKVIEGIRERFPTILIIQNAGLFLLGESKKFIDAVLIEDIASGYNFDSKEYFVKDKAEFDKRVELIEKSSNQHKIPFFIVDFADTFEAITEIKTRLDTLSIPYFISDIQLSKLPSNSRTVANQIRISY